MGRHSVKERLEGDMKIAAKMYQIVPHYWYVETRTDIFLIKGPTRIETVRTNVHRFCPPLSCPRIYPATQEDVEWITQNKGKVYTL